MATKFRVKRRAAGGAAGAPASLENAEVAYNEVDDTLYIGKGTGGAGGTATIIIPVAGVGAFVDKTSAQSIDGVKTFTSSPIVPTVTVGDNSTKVASTSFVAAAVAAANVGADTYQGTWNASTNTPAIASGTGVKGQYRKVSVAGSTSVDGITDWKVGDWIIYNGTIWEKVDNTDQVTSVNGFQGVVVLTKTDVGLSAVPNVDATARANHTGSQVSSTISDFAASVIAQVLTGLSVVTSTAVVAADSILVAIGKLQAQATAATTAIGLRLVASNNLSDVASAPTARTNLGLGTAATLSSSAVAQTANNLSDLASVGTARTNLGLGTMATQNAGAVAITGGTIDGVILDGGVF